MEVFRLYPQLNNNDRRQHNIPVDDDRRSYEDRRTRFASDSETNERRIDPVLRKDIDQVKDVFKSFHNTSNLESTPQQDLEISAASSIPYVRRLRGINDAIEQHDYIKAAGTAFLMLINVREDWRDITKIFKNPNTPHDFQRPFSFTRGTPLEKSNFLNKIDTTLDSTAIGQKILKITGLKGQQIYIDDKLDKLGREIYSYKGEGTLLSKITYRAFMRIPVLSLAFLAIMEIPSVIKSKDPFKQTLKSAINATSIVLGGALLGAIGAYFGPLGSLAGIGIGAYYAGKLAKKINSNIS